MPRLTYTHKERTQKDYTVEHAITSAKRRLRSKGIMGVCLDPIRSRNREDKITLEELNIIADKIVEETYYYEGL